ncbi:hypothetical protein LTR37_016893 [Vermiconidia calcicola]|uniref:Uncharacterized protein n=1 Tax=Vermiconidia calcicola TaxID=1690605 RepID=A0ACC3MP95_9PEZI|nr:hypothetical protein LTR37_016893 [Vermiconidia calcicola]
MPSSPNRSITALPAELIARIASFLPLADLKAWRFTHTSLAQAGFDALLSFMPRLRRLSIPRMDSLESFLQLARTPKANHTLKNLTFCYSEPDVTAFLDRTHLPQLERLSLENCVFEDEVLLTLLSNHAATLQLLRLEGVTLTTSASTVKHGKTAWGRILELVATTLQLEDLTISYLTYKSQDESLIEIVPVPEKHCGERELNGCVEDLVHENGAYIDFDYSQACTSEAVQRLARAFVDDEGKERFATKDDKPKVGAQILPESELVHLC